VSFPSTNLLVVNCPFHPDRELTCPACNGAKGGRSKSAKKVNAARKNWKRAVAGGNLGRKGKNG